MGDVSKPSSGQPKALEVLSQRIDLLRADGDEKREEAAKLLALATATALATTTRRLPFLAGAAVASAAVYRGYRKASESRDSATEASQLLALHQYDMFLQISDEGGAQAEPSSPPQ